MTDIQRSIEILDSLVGFDTTSRNSNLPLIDWVENFLRGCGVSYERIADQAGVKANIWATIGPADKPGYILSGHSDVVPVDGQSWASDPFRLSRRDGRLYGRGATDMKGYVACCLAAVPAMKARRLARPIHLAISYDEEVGCIGVQDIIARIKRGAVKPAGCFVGEPSLMAVIVGHKSKRSLRVTVRGHTAHSSLAPQGVNAVEYAARLIVKIRDISERLAREGARDPLYDVPFTTGHTGTVNGGTALNIVPESCTFEFEFRAIGADDVNALTEEVITYGRDVLEPAMKAVAPEAGIEFVDRSNFPGLNTSPDAGVVALAKQLAGASDYAKVAYGTEAGRFS
ncbi:MAG TPA: acetylornithine deacetylase, partial [Xanthobacteraceae bacterium]